MPQTITEARPLVITEALDESTGLFELQIISPGVGSSGAYPASVLEAAANAGVWAAGTHLYLDHPTRSEEAERPERSVRDLAGSLTEAGRWNGQAVVARARVYSTYRPLLAEAADDIGMSIRASATITEGEFEGQRMPIVSEIHEAFSVDFVTRAGRGGAVLSVLESARAAEAGTLDSERRERMSQAVRDAFDDAWVRDYDDDVLYVERYGDDAGTFRQPYTTDADGAITLTGDPVEVVAHTTYVPVDPAGQDTTTESQGGTMPQIEEARLRQLETDAGRVSVLETERDTARTEAAAATARAETAERALAESTAGTAATTRARARVVAANASLAPVVVDRIVTEATRAVPMTEAGALDETALDTATDAALIAEETYLRSLAPTGVTGFGSLPSGETGDTSALLAEMDRSAERAGLRSVPKGA